ncbi:MAG: phosphate/phosphite/phosphonate ABC transporter substrate-binding protein [Gemmataceae bacterium]
MNQHRYRARQFLVVLVPLLAALVLVTAQPDVAANAARNVRISISRALFRDMPEPIVLASIEPLGKILSQATGMRGTMTVADDGAELAEKLADQEIDVAIFDGVEFAWARQGDQRLCPLMITVNLEKSVRAFIITRSGDGHKDLGDLEDGRFFLAKNTRQHCLLFLEQECQRRGQSAEDFLVELCQKETAEEALDDLVDGKGDAVLIDNASFACYQQRKPARAKKLSILVQSIEFPSAVLACHKGGLEQGTVTKVQRSLGELDDSALGRQLLTLWKLQAFEKVPREFDQLLERVARDYPAPETYKKKARAGR